MTAAAGHVPTGSRRLGSLPRAPAAGWPFGLPGRLAAALGLLTLAGAAVAATALDARVDEPRAYGYQVGDVVERRAVVSVPQGMVLDAESLPRVGQRGLPIELRALDWQPLGGGRFELRLRYQVFHAPVAVRTMELPTLSLRFTGEPREQTLRLEGWPVTVAPLVPVDVSPRRGLGELQPDVPPPRFDLAPSSTRLAVYAALVGLGLLYLAYVYLGLPLLRRRRPFGRAWPQLAALPATVDAERWRGAARELHRALDASAGRAVFIDQVDDFLERRPDFRPVRAELLAFLAESREAFFGGSDATRPTASLRALGRRLRDLERGAA